MCRYCPTAVGDETGSHFHLLRVQNGGSIASRSFRRFGFDAGGDVDAPRPHLADRLGDVVGPQGGGEQDLVLRDEIAGAVSRRLPVLGWGSPPTTAGSEHADIAC